jgi:CheY-like chemotaxis protein
MDLKTLREWTRFLHVLYVEDEQEIREETAAFLHRLIDSVTVAENGEAGWNAFQKERFDLVITDLKMPRMGGEEMIKKIKSSDPGVILIAMSGISGNNGRQNLPSDFFIPKPASMEDFIRVLQQIHDRGTIETRRE